MRATLVLFDIDGTLVGGSRAGQTAYLEAIRICYHVRADLQNYSTAGKTDLLIMKELLETGGISEEDVDFKHLSAVFLQCLNEAVVHDPGQVLPGVEELLEGLAKRDGIYLALGTGNLEEAARIKLRIHKLDRYFKTGGFGSDALHRSAVIQTGIRKALRYYGIHFIQVVVVGDTPLDIEAAKANGAFSIAVASGPYSVNDLADAGATRVLPDLRHTEEFSEVLDSLPNT